MYTRASASDYDDWENFGNPGWGSDDLIPLASKVRMPLFEALAAVLTQNCSQAENYQCGVGRTHGTSGPISVSSENTVGVFGQQYLAIAAKYDKDRDFTEDPNDFKSCNKYGVRDTILLSFTFR